MSTTPAAKNDRTRTLVIMTVIGAVVGAVGGAVGFSDSGVNVVAGLIGLCIGALVMGGLTFLVNETAAVAPPWLSLSLASAFMGWLFGGVVWEMKLETKLHAQLAGAAFGLLVAVVFLLRGHVAKRNVARGDDPTPPSSSEHLP